MRLKSIAIEVDEKDKIKNKIEQRFKHKPTGRMIMKLANGTKLAVEYMYGNRYCLKRKEKGKKAQLIIALDKADKVASEMVKEKARAKVRYKQLSLF